MIHLHEETRTEALDIDQLRRSIGAGLDALRELDITEAGVVAAHGGPRRAGLRLTKGRHPLPGAAYRLTTAGTVVVEGETVHRTTETDVEVLTDTPDLVQLQGRTVGSKESWAVTLSPATMPTQLTIDLMGTVEASIDIDLEHLPGGPDPQVEATVLHRFAAAEGTVAVAVDATDPTARWRWTVRAEGRGRSIVRPIASLAWLFTRRRVKAEVGRLLDDALVEGVAGLASVLSEQGSDVDAGARRTIDALIDELPETLPGTTA